MCTLQNIAEEKIKNKAEEKIKNRAGEKIDNKRYSGVSSKEEADIDSKTVAIRRVIHDSRNGIDRNRLHSNIISYRYQYK